MIEVTTYDSLADGKLELKNKDQFIRALKNIKDGPVELIVKRWRANRSTQQNAWYHACIIPIITDAINELQGEEAFSRTEIHEFLKSKFNTRTVINEGGQEVRIARSTSNLTTTEFTAYVEQVRAWAIDMLDVTIPDPDTNYTPKPRKRRNADDIFVGDAYVAKAR